MVDFDRSRMLSALARQDEGYARRDPTAIRNSTLDTRSRIFKELYLIALLLEDVAGLRAPGRLLEVGCGLGAMTLAFRALAGRVTAIDLSESAVAGAQERLSGIDAVTVAQADGTNPTACAAVASQRFDVIVFREFHPFTRPFYESPDAAAAVHRAVLRDYLHLLAPGGAILIMHAEYNDQVIRPERLGLGHDADILVSRADPRLAAAFLVLTRNRPQAALALARFAQPLLWRLSTRNVLYLLQKRAGEA